MIHKNTDTLKYLLRFFGIRPFIAVGLFLSLLTACASNPFSSQDRSWVDSGVPIAEVLRHPHEEVGEKVLFGGRIVNIKRHHMFSRISIIVFPLDNRDRPQVDKPSLGHAMVVTEAPLDPARYRISRKIEVIGTVLRPKEVKSVDGKKIQIAVVRAYRLHVSPSPAPPGVGMGLGMGFFLP